jgi:hypothetical protein
MDKLNAHYGKSVAKKFVQYTGSTGNNDMYLWLSSDKNLDCASSTIPSADSYYDVIGGAYAINEPRKKVSYMSPSYYPLNMAVIHTKAPLKDATLQLKSADDIKAAAANADAGLILAALPDTGESVILNDLQKKTGETFAMVLRDPKSNVLEW